MRRRDSLPRSHGGRLGRILAASSAALVAWLASIAAFVALIGFAVPVAHAQDVNPTIVVRPGERLSHRVAVQRFLLDQPAVAPGPEVPAARLDPPGVERFRESLAEGLAFTPAVSTLPDAAFLRPVETERLHGASRDDCPDWRQSGADAVVEGVIRPDGSLVEVEVAVWDAARCLRLLREKYARPQSSLPLLARRIADDVVGAITGKRGAASTEIAFISTRTGQREVMVMQANGENARAATRANSVKAFPTWFPGGEGILYTAYVTGLQPGLYVTARSRSLRAGSILGSVLPGQPKYRGVFHPSGDRLALVSSEDGAAEIFVVERSGGGLERLTFSPSIEISPVWSPDGKQIAFVSDRSGSPQIYVMNADGTNKRRLTFEGSYNTNPAWSPDGRWIAYQTRLQGQFDIWLIDPSGEVNFPLVEHPRTDEAPSWSPDSRRIAFSSTRRGRADLYLVDVGGPRLERLTRGAGDNIYPSWGPYPR